MKLRVQYMAQLRAVIGYGEQLVELPEASRISDLLVQLAAQHPAARSHLVTESNQPRPSLLIVVNDAAVSSRDAAATSLQPNDVVTLLPPIAGG